MHTYGLGPLIRIFFFCSCFRSNRNEKKKVMERNFMDYINLLHGVGVLHKKKTDDIKKKYNKN